MRSLFQVKHINDSIKSIEVITNLEFTFRPQVTNNFYH